MGGIAVAGNMIASSYSVNSANRPAVTSNGSYALTVGGTVALSSAHIGGGLHYPATGYTNVGFTNSSLAVNAGVNFASNASTLAMLSVAVGNLAASGSISLVYGGLTFTGINSSVEIFNLTPSQLQAATWVPAFQNIAANASFIVNINGGGGNVVIPSFSWNTFDNRNVLFNIRNAPNITFNNVGFLGSVLAPQSTVLNGGGNLNGNIIVGNWNSNIEVHDHSQANNYDYYWDTVDVPGLIIGSTSSDVPEPRSIALFMLGLGVMSVYRIGKQHS
jgi:choice-of-anchor A domain-containing protein